MQPVEAVEHTAQARLIHHQHDQRCALRISHFDPGISDVPDIALVQLPRNNNAIERGFAEAQNTGLAVLVQSCFSQSSQVACSNHLLFIYKIQAGTRYRFS